MQSYLTRYKRHLVLAIISPRWSKLRNNCIMCSALLNLALLDPFILVLLVLELCNSHSSWLNFRNLEVFESQYLARITHVQCSEWSPIFPFDVHKNHQISSCDHQTPEKSPKRVLRLLAAAANAGGAERPGWSAKKNIGRGYGEWNRIRWLH